MYDKRMRFILLAIFVLFAAQPVPVAACDMHDGQQPVHNPAGTMPDSSMDHDGEGMDCCDQDPENPADGCSSLSHCGACPAGLIALIASAPNVGIGTFSQQYLPATSGPPNRTVSPPFKPPIA